MDARVLLKDLKPHEETSPPKVKALARNGCRFAKAFLVDYGNEAIKVFPRRENVPVSKKIVVERALSRNLFPRKTTRHALGFSKSI